MSNLEDHLREQDEITAAWEAKVRKAKRKAEVTNLRDLLEAERLTTMQRRRDLALANEGREALQVMLSEEVRQHGVTRQAVKVLREAAWNALYPMVHLGEDRPSPHSMTALRHVYNATAPELLVRDRIKIKVAADDTAAMADTMGMALGVGPLPVKVVDRNMNIKVLYDAPPSPPETILDVVKEIRDMLRTAY